MRLEQGTEAIVLLRTEHQISAFPDCCPHAQWRLSEGELIHGVLECPGHGWQFDAATGACLTAATYRLRPLPVHVQADRVSIQW